MHPEASPQKSKATGFLPDYLVESVTDIDVETLKARGVRYLILDVDHTLMPWHASEIDKGIRDYILALRLSGQFEAIYLASNSRRDLKAVADSIGAIALQPLGRLNRKPTRAYFRRLLATIGCSAHEAVMVGDKLLTDIWGANRAGMVTVLVNPIGPDALFDRLLFRRFWRSRYLRRHRS